MILVVEDNDILRNLVAHQFDKLGFEGDFTGSAHQALALASKGPYELILLDLNLKDIDGFEVARQIRAQERREMKPRVPIVAVTGMYERRTCLDAGLDDYVGKPMLLDHLKAVIERWAPKLAEREQIDRP